MNAHRRLAFALLLACSAGARAQEQVQGDLLLTIQPRHSLVRVGNSPNIVTDQARKIAATFWAGTASNNVAHLRRAADGYAEIERKEKIGGDYGALRWLAEALLEKPEARQKRFDTPLTEEFFTYFSTNQCGNLRLYLQLKYGVGDWLPQMDPQAFNERCAYLEDLMMFGNPKRSEWECSDDLVKHVPISKGDTVLDIGCSFGYYSYRFANAAGKGGRVYAIDINDQAVDFVKVMARNHAIDNILPVVSRADDIVVDTPADVAFICSLYHIIYTWSPEKNQVSFIQSIKRALRPGGYLVIADNTFRDGEELHNCYVHRELVQAQLHYYGFTLEKCIDVTDRRYLMLFKNEPGKLSEITVPGDGSKGPPLALRVSSPKSIVHIGSLDSFDITEPGIAAAKQVLDALNKKDRALAKQASDAYEKLIPSENFGGEYTALQWFCDYWADDDDGRAKMTADPFVSAFFHHLADGDYSNLVDYVSHKYKLEGRKLVDGATPDEQREVGRTRRALLEDFILFNNPRRGAWEKTEEILKLVGAQPGEAIADIGSGPGFFSVLLSKAVGPQGRVYAMDTKYEHLDFLDQYAQSQKIANITTVRSATDDIKIKGPVDCAYMCSLYHIIYGVSSEPERDKLLTSIRKALRPGGRFIVVDNGPVDKDKLPYHGPYISKELIVGQLAHYGFELQSSHQIIPQRYLLVFKKTK
jgi:ubiquinone/menaquinone biosynthesis C-methylase UbiE